MAELGVTNHIFLVITPCSPIAIWATYRGAMATMRTHVKFCVIRVRIRNCPKSEVTCAPSATVKPHRDKNFRTPERESGCRGFLTEHCIPTRFWYCPPCFQPQGWRCAALPWEGGCLGTRGPPSTAWARRRQRVCPGLAAGVLQVPQLLFQP